MKSFQNFTNQIQLNEIDIKVIQPSLPGTGKKFIKKKKTSPNIDIETARKKLEKTPTLSDDEMRQQNPKATAAYEKDVEQRKAASTVEPSPRTSAAKDAFADMKAETERQTKKAAKRAKAGKINYKALSKAIKDLPAEPSIPKSTRTAAQKAAPGLYRVPVSRQLPAPAKTVSKPATVRPTAKPPALTSKSLVSTKPQSMGRVLKDVLKTEREAKAAQRAAFATGAKTTLGNVGKVAGLVGAGLEAKSGYETARAQGASRKTAAGVGGLRAAGALAGGAIGGALGGVLGVPGAIGGGVAGYTLGAKAGEAAAKAIRGDYAKKLTSKDVLSNVRKAVPYSIRSQVPTEVRKSYRDFVTQAGKTYGNWSRQQSKVGNR